MKHRNAQKILNKVRSRNARIVVVGLGYVGLPLLNAFAQKGFSVIGVDLSGQEVEGKPIIALIGREVLGRTLFVYNGRGGFFSICT